jgi:hypothetical protein
MATEKVQGAARVTIEIDLDKFVANTWQDDNGEYQDGRNSPRDQIVERAAQMIREDIGAEIIKDVRKAVTPTIEAQVGAVIMSALSGEFRPVDQWGEPGNKVTTLRAQIAKEATEWLTKKSNRYDGPSNLQKIVKEVVDRTLSQDFAKIIAEEKAAIFEQIRAAAAVLLAKEATKR